MHVWVLGNDLPITGMPKGNEEIYQQKCCEPEVMTWEHHRDSTENHHDLWMCVLVAQSCPTLCNRMDYSPPGSSAHGILQARTPEWVAISLSCDYHTENQ